MSCEYEEDLTAFVDGELAPLRAKQVEGHLAGCAGCAGTLKLLQRTVAQVAQLAATEREASAAAPSLRRAVLTRVDEPSGWAEQLRALLRPPVLMPALGMAAAVAICVVVLGERQAGLKLETAEQALFAQSADVLDDFDVVGLEDLDDLEVVEHLHELEVTP